MDALAQAALTRLSLPHFAGNTNVERLIAAEAAARASLLKYVSKVEIDPDQAALVMSMIGAWTERRRPELEAAMRDPATSLPGWLQQNIGTNLQVQQWVLANYANAAYGMGPWVAGKIDARNIPAWADLDAQTRINIFGMIVKMDQDGELKQIFVGEAHGIAPVIVWAVVVAVVALAAVCAYSYLEGKRIEVNNNLMRDICVEAQKSGDKATVELCVKATRDIQVQTDAVGNFASQVRTLVGVALLGFAAIYFVPKLVKSKREAVSA